jgi:hypothetical protein
MVENQLKQMPGLTDGAMQEAEKNRILMEETKLRTIMEVKNPPEFLFFLCIMCFLGI